MRAIHYSIRYAVVFILSTVCYGILAALFHETLQIAFLITLFFMVFGAERMWVLLDWVGPVVGTMNKKKQEQDRKLIVEYLLENSLRYGSPLVIAAVCGKKRISLHVVARLLRKSDIVLRSAAGYLLILMPFTSLEQTPVALNRLAKRLPIKSVVVTDVSMLQALVTTHTTQDNAEATGPTVRNLRRMCLQALDEKVAELQTTSSKTDAPAIYNLFPASAQSALFAQQAIVNVDASQMNDLSAKDERILSDINQ